MFWIFMLGFSLNTDIVEFQKTTNLERLQIKP